MTLVLFDIDGTILRAHGLGRRHIESVFSELMGRPVRADGIAFAGRTDPAIASDLLRRAGASPADLPDLVERGLAGYADRLLEWVRPGDVELLPGVHTLLDRLHRRNDVVLGLVTGNLERTAYAKLGAAGLDGLFAFGGFGSDHADRQHLPAVAMARAEQVTGRVFRPVETVVVGDTPHDVRCGRSAGTRTLAVCTGFAERAALEAEGPDLLLDDLAATDAVEAWILGPTLP